MGRALPVGDLAISTWRLDVGRADKPVSVPLRPLWRRYTGHDQLQKTEQKERSHELMAAAW